MPPVEVADDNESALPEESAGTALALTDEVSTALVEATSINTKVAALADEARKYHALTTGTVADPKTTAGMETLVAIRAKFRDDFRIPMQKAQETGSKLFGTLQRKYNEHARALIAEVELLEKPWDTLITQEQARKAAIKAEKERVEAARVQAHSEKIARISGVPGAAAGCDSANLRARIEGLSLLEVDASFEEFQGQAMQAKDEALRQLNGMLIAALADEEDRAELERTRLQQAAFAAEQAKREQQLANERAAFEAEKAALAAAGQRLQEEAAAREREQREALEKQQQELERQRLENERALRERAEAIDARIQAMLKLAATAHQAVHSADIKTLEAKVPPVESITSDLFGDRLQEAAEARVAVMNTMAALHEKATAREEQEKAQARAAKIEELLSAIENMGEDASDAVKDGSADVEKLRIGLKALQDTECTPDLFDDRADEAVTLKTAAEEIIEWAIKATQERDRLRAEEAERVRQQEEEGRALRDRHLRMVEKAGEMYALLKDMMKPASGKVVVRGDHALAGSAIIKFVEGDHA